MTIELMIKGCDFVTDYQIVLQLAWPWRPPIKENIAPSLFHNRWYFWMLRLKEIINRKVNIFYEISESVIYLTLAIDAKFSNIMIYENFYLYKMRYFLKW